MPHITNYKQLAKTPLRKKALAIVEAGYAAIEITAVIKKRITVRKGIMNIVLPDEKTGNVKINLNDYKRVFLVGIGKGSALASVEVAKVLGKRLTKGIAIDVERPPVTSHQSPVTSYVGTHPLPSSKNVRATKKIMQMVSNLNADDLVVVFMCGGGSALAVASDDELSASTTVFKELTRAGADIIELNTVRKHLSDIKGGNLAKTIYPATLLTLMASDVIGNDMEMIASGPTIADSTTKRDAVAVLKKYGIAASTLPLKETPKDDKYFKSAKNILFIANKDAVRAMADEAKKNGLRPRIKTLALKGEAKGALVSMMRGIKRGQVMLAAGETTVTLKQIPAGKKAGRGGRNQEAVLGVLAAYAATPKKLDDIVAIAFASDGHDNSEAAGAIADRVTLQAAMRAGQRINESLASHASRDFFKKNGNLIRVSNKSFNIADLLIVIRGR